jgi:hypothetical protein
VTIGEGPGGTTNWGAWELLKVSPQVVGKKEPKSDHWKRSQELLTGRQ